MLSENIKAIRKSKGLSQEELAVKLNVVRQTVSKWEQGLSVPDADLLLSLSKVLETPVNVLLGEETAPEAEDSKVLAEKIEAINLHFTQKKAKRRKIVHWVFILLCIAVVAIAAVLVLLKSPYLNFDYSDPDYAVFGVFFHVFEWWFVRSAPFILIGAIVGAILTRKKT